MVDLASKYGIIYETYRRCILKPSSSTQLPQTHHPPPKARRLQFGPQPLTSVISGKMAYSAPGYPPAPPKVYFAPPSCTPRPAPVWLPVPHNFLHRAVKPSPYRHMENRITDDAPGPVEPTPSTGDPESVSVDEYVRKFQNWRLGGESFGSPAGGEGLELRMQMPKSDFIRFSEILDVGDDEKFPKISFNALTSTLIIQHAPSPIHEKVISTVSEGFNLARSSLPTPLRQRITIVFNQKFCSFKRGYKGSRKVPDTMVEVENAAGTLEVKFILEVGYTETYDDLVRDARIWLEGTDTVSAVMLVKLNEDPAYQNPTSRLTDEEFDNLEFPPSEEVSQELFSLDEAHGPACYKGLRWVGKITSSLEIWKRHPTSHLAIRTFGPHNHLNSDNTTYIYFHLCDFLDVSFEENHHIGFDWGLFHRKLGTYIRQLAVERCVQALEAREGRANVLDRDFQPSPAAGST
ncbi:unnamed protein product [Tuber melanosporum]|uniref:(Perigord truffle) hypothetical protein n=1 Tax=Tuber melanosporum (strain Mel28) TaxID=656061 RepID=D5GN98_TUBMM|nr:uncharacterized protein GSTUM_00011182001 [Tuber melanosporum]CAZ85991.1 unnamed protein product [Tuber melanosporum]